ncbi:MAG: hypothetical protein HRT47_06460 [Candidatus Caenarcaniphilales bacterium]|nr:hypothetical protein [Candidatus Caenarcaniphilales bacterium]
MVDNIKTSTPKIILPGSVKYKETLARAAEVNKIDDSNLSKKDRRVGNLLAAFPESVTIDQAFPDLYQEDESITEKVG